MRAWARANVMAALMILALVLVAEGAPPDVQRGGKVITDFGEFDSANALVLQPDGKLVAAGSSSVLRGGGTFPNNDFALARYLSDGRLDSTFGTGGMVITDFGFGSVANALVLQPDGKLVAAGFIGFFASDGSSRTNVALARYLPDGTLDPTFGTGGKVITDVGTDSDARALVLRPDGKLVVAGCIACVQFGDFALARYLSDGSLDTTFGVGGIVTTDFSDDGGDDFESAFALVLQPDGKLIAAGNSDDPVTFATRFALARYLPDGSLDATFGVGGKVTTDFGGPWASALILQPDGKLIAGGPGYSGICCFERFALARYLPDGSLDATFGVGGKVTTDFGGQGLSTVVNAFVLQPDGKLVAAGAGSDNCCTQRFALARLLLDGTLDATFGVGGIVTTDFPPTAGFGTSQARALVLQPDGKLVAAGVVDGEDFGLARYRPDGTLDPAFGTGFETNVNVLIDFVVQSTSLNPDAVPGGPAGVFTITARLTNTSMENILEPINAIVRTLTNGNKLLSATEGNGGVGSLQAMDAGSDNVLIPNESATVQFRIGLANRNLFSFFVDVSGIVGGDD